MSYGSYTLELTAKITHLTYPDTILCLNTDFTGLMSIFWTQKVKLLCCTSS